MKFRKPEEMPTGGGSKNFLKLKDKESISGIFRGDIHEFFVLWEGGKSQTVEEGVPGARFRFRVNFVTKEGSAFVAKIFEQGLTVYQQLAELHTEYDLEQTTVKITRNGTGTDTTYSLLPLLKAAPTKETLKYLDTMELLPLEANGAKEAHDTQESETPF